MLNNRDYNIDQNNRDYDFCHNWAALRQINNNLLKSDAIKSLCNASTSRDICRLHLKIG